MRIAISIFILLVSACTPQQKWFSAPSRAQHLDSDLQHCILTTRGDIDIDFTGLPETPEVKTCMRRLGHTQGEAINGVPASVYYDSITRGAAGYGMF
jgi:hypothetical protein